MERGRRLLHRGVRAGTAAESAARQRLAGGRLRDQRGPVERRRDRSREPACPTGAVPETPPARLVVLAESFRGWKVPSLALRDRGE